MVFAFTAEYNVGDEVKVLAGEHDEDWERRIGFFYDLHVVADITRQRESNGNWKGRIGRIAEIGIDLYQVVYMVEFKGEVFKPCFRGEDLKLVSMKSKVEPLKEILMDAKYKIGDKVKVLPRARSLKTDLDTDG